MTNSSRRADNDKLLALCLDIPVGLASTDCVRPVDGPDRGQRRGGEGEDEERRLVGSKWTSSRPSGKTKVGLISSQQAILKNNKKKKIGEI